MNTSSTIEINHFSDVLCVWAYLAQIRVDELRKDYGQEIRIEYHFTPVFGDIPTRIGQGWQAKGGYEGYAQHVQHVAQDFPHINLHPQVWRENIPKSSHNAHLFLKAAELALIDTPASPALRTPYEELIWQMRHAFFHHAVDITHQTQQLLLAEQQGLDCERIISHLQDGSAMAALCRDQALVQEFSVTGSPTYVLNSGRQKLYGNVGYKLIAANVHELLHQPEHQASWC